GAPWKERGGPPVAVETGAEVAAASISKRPLLPALRPPCDRPAEPLPSSHAPALRRVGDRAGASERSARRVRRSRKGLQVPEGLHADPREEVRRLQPKPRQAPARRAHRDGEPRAQE